MSGYERENRNVLRRCLKTASDGAAVTWAGRSFHTAAPEVVNVRLPTGSTNDRYVQAIRAGRTQSKDQGQIGELRQPWKTYKRWNLPGRSQKQQILTDKNPVEYGTMVAREFADWGYRSHVQAFIHWNTAQHYRFMRARVNTMATGMEPLLPMSQCACGLDEGQGHVKIKTKIQQQHNTQSCRPCLCLSNCAVMSFCSCCRSCICFWL